MHLNPTCIYISCKHPRCTSIAMGNEEYRVLNHRPWVLEGNGHGSLADSSYWIYLLCTIHLDPNLKALMLTCSSSRDPKSALVLGITGHSRVLS